MNDFIDKVITPGQEITSDPQFMRGHGTQMVDDTLCSLLAGQVQKVNKLISVISPKSRYNGEIGDVVVGRISEVNDKKWKVDLNGKTNATLQLSAVNLPGGVQRRRLESDELQMRSFFQEGDLIVAEVQQYFHDGSLSLHTRSLKYGKLKNGIVLQVSPNLIERSKTHFIHLPMDIYLILGLNGNIFISPFNQEMTMEQIENQPELMYASTSTHEITPNQRSLMARISNCIKILNKNFITINENIIYQLFEASLSIEPKDLLKEQVQNSLLEILLQK